ncbi:MAG: ATP-binding cassette domain-containing protein [Armatimonadetes bacterium]|nr:ATP-binding cassette domain-containing protein [Armatimonadota bacterium]
MLSVRGLHHWFGDNHVLDAIDLDVDEGEILAVMGSSGGGKTTLLKCISGLLRPTEGEITVDGIDVKKNPEEAHRRMGLVFQYAALFDYLDVSQNILFGVQRRRRISRKDGDALVQERLADVGLSGTERMMPSELSGGMRKRVGLARALALEPKLLLYDEPTSGLDPVTAFSIDELIVETCRKRKVTSIVVSHDVTSVFRVADRIAFLSEGRVLFQGTPDEFQRAQEGPIGELVEKSRAETLHAD